ncbi:hypothetical protein V3C99_002964, partial [Haemonchus contortus]
SECDLLSEAGQSTIDGLAITINRELVHNHPSQRTLQRHTLVLIGSRDGVGRTRKKNRITNLDGTVICAKKHDCPTESSLLLSADLFRRICREAIRAGIRSRHRLHLNRPALSLDGSSTYTCSCATRREGSAWTDNTYVWKEKKENSVVQRPPKEIDMGRQNLTGPSNGLAARNPGRRPDCSAICSRLSFHERSDRGSRIGHVVHNGTPCDQLLQPL